MGEKAERSLPPTNIQFAVDAAGDNDTVWVKPGRYTLPTDHVALNGTTNVVYVNKPLTIRSDSSALDTSIE